jgi:hypothetical protein
MKIEEMADVFLNLANFAPQAFLTLAPPSGYALNLKALIKMSKVSQTSQLSYETFTSSLERKFDKTNFISPKSTPPKSPHLLGLICNIFSIQVQQIILTCPLNMADYVRILISELKR